MQQLKQYNAIDKLILTIDQGLRTLFSEPVTTERANPAAKLEEATLSSAQKKDIAGMMRVNHSGEVCAQALYQGQALTAQLGDVRAAMERAALEENDHLDWCATRLKELSSHTSYMNVLWYSGSLIIGMLAGLAGDKWSLGFVVETERQVVAHLERHLQRIPPQDVKTRAILEQMIIDEGHHATVAYNAGGIELPFAIKSIMSLVSKVMTTLAYRI